MAVVGRVRGNLVGAVADYEARASRYWKLEVVEVSAGGPGRDADPEAVKQAEAQRLLTRIPVELEVVALTREGRGMDSRELSRYLERHAVCASAGVAFVVGGAYGLGDEVLARARRTLSLSSMTLPHEMARLMLAEQLYRAGTILRGEPYHKG
jgi:23S rRNA (pseudouridine1915-N3)-methyltransferase